jgi:hypothetical protein
MNHPKINHFNIHDQHSKTDSNPTTTPTSSPTIPIPTYPGHLSSIPHTHNHNLQKYYKQTTTTITMPEPNHGNPNLTLPFDHTVPNCPATAERQQAALADAFIAKPGIARANLAVSADMPEGSATSKRAAVRDYVRFFLLLFLCFWFVLVVGPPCGMELLCFY